MINRAACHPQCAGSAAEVVLIHQLESALVEDGDGEFVVLDMHRQHRVAARDWAAARRRSRCWFLRSSGCRGTGAGQVRIPGGPPRPVRRMACGMPFSMKICSVVSGSETTNLATVASRESCTLRPMTSMAEARSSLTRAASAPARLGSMTENWRTGAP